MKKLIALFAVLVVGCTQEIGRDETTGKVEQATERVTKQACVGCTNSVYSFAMEDIVGTLWSTTDQCDGLKHFENSGDRGVYLDVPDVQPGDLLDVRFFSTYTISSPAANVLYEAAARLTATEGTVRTPIPATLMYWDQAPTWQVPYANPARHPINIHGVYKATTAGTVRIALDACVTLTAYQSFMLRTSISIVVNKYRP
jgi:hypothetical protein